MNTSWRKVELGQICSFKYGEMPKKTDLCETGYPVFSGYRIVGAAKRFHYEEPQIIVVARGVGGTGDVKMSPPFCFLTNLSIAVRPEDPNVNRAFLYYRLAGPKLWDLRTGSAQAQITIERLRTYEIELPPLRVQIRIASILGAYDELIEVNRRRVSLLEKMTWRLFEEWFVHHRFPGHDSQLAIETPEGPLPQGWQSCAIGDVFDILGGGTPSKSVESYWTAGTINWYTPTDLTGSKTAFMDASGLQITDAGLRHSSAHLFPAFSVMMTSRATLGVISINTTEACTNQGFIICIPNERVPLCFLRNWLRAKVPTFVAHATGSTFKEITKGVFRRLPIVVPPQELVAAYEKFARPALDMVLELERVQRRLIASRDLILPRLISGELSVSGAESELEAVA